MNKHAESFGSWITTIGETTHKPQPALGKRLEEVEEEDEGLRTVVCPGNFFFKKKKNHIFLLLILFL
jgi:hypothetical protein